MYVGNFFFIFIHVRYMFQSIFAGTKRKREVDDDNDHDTRDSAVPDPNEDLDEIHDPDLMQQWHQSYDVDSWVSFFRIRDSAHLRIFFL